MEAKKPVKSRQNTSKIKTDEKAEKLEKIHLALFTNKELKSILGGEEADWCIEGHMSTNYLDPFIWKCVSDVQDTITGKWNSDGVGIDGVEC